jgi:hypothetical protein
MGIVPQAAALSGHRTRDPCVVTSGAGRELVDRNNYLASDSLRVPVEQQLALQVLDDPIDHVCAKALTHARCCA